ncbi:MAG: endonuclease/exonuclease/phosphatase family protein [Anaerolineae bacterium]|nr:endonuclease/exonuclease/phosphatase family protein [Anaerolineae bacterium]
MQSDWRRNSILLPAVLYGILLLFFLQLLTDFVEAIYVFGLLGTGIPVEIAAVLLLFSPLLLLLLPQTLSRRAALLVAGLMLVCRITGPLLDTRGRMFVAGLGAAAWLILLPSLLTRRDNRRFSIGLALALTLSILFRALGSGSDVSTGGTFQFLGWLLAFAAGALLLLTGEPGPEPAPARGRPASGSAPSFWRTAALALGVMGTLVLSYFVFSAPNVIARWTGVAYLPIVALLSAVVTLSAALLFWKPGWLALLSPGVVVGWNILFVLALVLAIAPHQVPFPADPAAYPFPAPPASAFHPVPLFLLLLLVPILPIDLMLFARELTAMAPSSHRLGGAFSLASLYLLVMILAHIFTSTYDYIPVIGPFFRDRFWLVHLVAGLAAALPLLALRRPSAHLAPDASRGRTSLAVMAALLLLFIATVAGAAAAASRPAAPPDAVPPLTVMTYNIQQGNSEDGQRNFDGQLDVIRSADPDVVGLVENDTNRIANGNTDVVRYFADRLDMYSYYGPKTVVGTFGVALLSKYRIENARTVYHHSAREQEATIDAQIRVGGRTFRVYVTHLASEDKDENLAQMQEILEMMQAEENVILFGDFNFRPDTPQYRLTAGALDDSWLLRWPGGTPDQGIDPARRIDHIFVSPGTYISDSYYIAGLESDHPAMVTIIE